MSEINKIYEITQRLSSPDNLRDDIREAMELLSKHFTAKYLSPINVAIASHRQYCSSHPTREIHLLNALKPFVSSDDVIEGLINAFNTYRLIYDIQVESNCVVSAAQLEDSAIHSDGIYEIDQGCIGTDIQSTSPPMNTEGIFMLLLILLTQKNNL